MPDQESGTQTPTLGQVIRQRRTELGLTQEELAERIGESVRQAEISRLERDHIVLPRRSRLEKIARALDVPIGVLLAHSGWVGAEDLPQSGNGDDSETVRLQAENAELEARNDEFQATIEELWTTREDAEARARDIESNALRHVTAHERLLTIFDGVEDGVVVVDLDGSIVFRNAAFTAIVERHGEEVILADEHGKRFPVDTHPFQRVARGEEFSLDIVFIGSGKRDAYVAHGKPMMTDSGLEIGVVTIQDCSEDCDAAD